MRGAELVPALPLPLARALRRALYALTPEARDAFHAVALRLAASIALAAWVRRGSPGDEGRKACAALVRPTLADWQAILGACRAALPGEDPVRCWLDAGICDSFAKPAVELAAAFASGDAPRLVARAGGTAVLLSGPAATIEPSRAPPDVLCAEIGGEILPLEPLWLFDADEDDLLSFHAGAGTARAEYVTGRGAVVERDGAGMMRLLFAATARTFDAADLAEISAAAEVRGLMERATGVRIGPSASCARSRRAGRGVLYEAFQEDPPRRVALKTLTLEAALDERTRRRMKEDRRRDPRVEVGEASPRQGRRRGGEEALANGDPAGAAVAAERALERDPSSAGAYLLRDRAARARDEQRRKSAEREAEGARGEAKGKEEEYRKVREDVGRLEAEVEGERLVCIEAFAPTERRAALAAREKELARQRKPSGSCRRDARRWSARRDLRSRGAARAPRPRPRSRSTSWAAGERPWSTGTSSASSWRAPRSSSTTGRARTGPSSRAAARSRSRSIRPTRRPTSSVRVLRERADFAARRPAAGARADEGRRALPRGGVGLGLLPRRPLPRDHGGRAWLGRGEGGPRAGRPRDPAERSALRRRALRDGRRRRRWAGRQGRDPAARPDRVSRRRPDRWLSRAYTAQRVPPHLLVANGKTLEVPLDRKAADTLGLKSAMPAQIVQGAGPMTVLCLRAGAPLTLDVPDGIATGLAVEPTAYPLILSRENRIAPGAPLDADPGSYLLLVHHDAFEDQRFAIVVPRGQAAEARVSLLKRGTTPVGFVFIPPGPFVYGGDPEAGQAAPREVPHVPGFFIGRLEVTQGEWHEFVNDPLTLKEIEAARARGQTLYLPRDEARPQGYSRRIPDGTYSPFIGPLAATFGVSKNDIDAYVAWRNARAEKAGEAWVYDLPTSREWEKAARGVDARLFPWGDRFDPSLCVGPYRASQLINVNFAPYEPRDLSPYGVFDLAGSRWEWTADEFKEGTGTYGVRGGSMTGTTLTNFRSCSRNGTLPTYVSVGNGFRLVARPRR